MSFSADLVKLIESAETGLVTAPWWERVPQSAVATILNGFPWQSKYFGSEQGAPLIRIRDVTTGDTETRYDGPITEGYWVEPGDFLVGMDGDFNSTVWQGERGLLNQRVCRITPDERFYLKEFLALVLPGYLKLVNAATHSVTVKHLSSKTLADLPLPLPSISEQRRITTKIHSLSGKSKRACDHLDHIPRLVEKYKEAVLQAAFSGELTDTAHKATFSRISFSEVIASTFYGPRIASNAYVESGIPTLRTTDISDWGRLVLKSPPQVQVSETDFAKWGLQDQDLIVTRTGATIGKCAVYEKAIGPALPSAYLIRVRLLLDRIDAKFALLFLLSPDGQRQLLAGRTAVAQPNINAGAICAVTLPVPNLDLQQEIVRRIQIAFAWIDRLASETTSARKLIDHLDQAILSKAFRGELVPQDPNDESASVLLERIKAARTAGATSGQGRRRTRA